MALDGLGVFGTFDVAGLALGAYTLGSQPTGGAGLGLAAIVLVGHATPLKGLAQALEADFGMQLDIPQWVRDDSTLNEDGILERCVDASDAAYKFREEQIGSELMRTVEKQVMLRQLDLHWKEHLAAMDHLRQGIGLRSYAQKNPKQEYKREAFEMFSGMLDSLKQEVVGLVSRVQIRAEEDVAEVERQRQQAAAAAGDFQFKHEEFGGFSGDQAAPAPEAAPPPEAPKPFVRPDRKVGRNEPCPCGSGKKFKHCHGRVQ